MFANARRKSSTAPFTSRVAWQKITLRAAEQLGCNSVGVDLYAGATGSNG